MTGPILARWDPSRQFRVVSRRALFHAGGADAVIDRPAHVRSASGIAWDGDRLALVEDDAHFLAWVDPLGGDATTEVLPSSPEGRRQFDDLRGNKHEKLDLESLVTVDRADGPTLLGFGSGSLPPREAVLRRRPGGSAEILAAPALYAILRAEREFAGSELNVEGAARLGSEIWLVNRGNGAATDRWSPADALLALDLDSLLAYLDGGPSPMPLRTFRYDLGRIDGARLTFTDVTTDGEGLVFLAAAEDSPDAVQDGPVRGVAMGRLDPGGPAVLHAVLDEDGRPLKDKTEGIAPDGDGGYWVVFDRDDPWAASLLLHLRPSGPAPQ